MISTANQLERQVDPDLAYLREVTAGMSADQLRSMLCVYVGWTRDAMEQAGDCRERPAQDLIDSAAESAGKGVCHASR